MPAKTSGCRQGGSSALRCLRMHGSRRCPKAISRRIFWSAAPSATPSGRSRTPASRARLSGWVKTIKWMRCNKIDVYSVVPKSTSMSLRNGWPANGFGPDRKTPHFRAPAPPSGDAARVVITEYDVGYPDTWAHDMEVEPSTGMAWVGDYTHDELIRVDPRNGAQKVYKLPVKGSGVHTLHFDRDGALWMTFQLADMVCRFDPRDRAIPDLPGAQERVAGPFVRLRYVRLHPVRPAGTAVGIRVRRQCDGEHRSQKRRGQGIQPSRQ